ncbi:MAG: pyruvate kinase [Myxococcales bacterium]|nr:pyruvate kinase [Myxococcales bacterium]
MRNAKILATVGPASDNPETLEALIRAGVDGFRLNFSHGSIEQHRATLARIRAASETVGKLVAVLGDLSGPKIRCGTFASGPVELREGAPFTLTTRAVPGDQSVVSCTYPLARDLKVGDTILLDDGLLRLRVARVHEDDVACVVEVGGTLSDRKGINVPGATLSVPALTDKDRRDAAAGVEMGVDYFALSFVRTARDLEEAQGLIGETPLVAKVEKPEAVLNLESVIDACDGVMVARGDLGVELGTEKVPLVQKRAIRMTNARGKLVITATQMLDSMIRSPRPTRAEAADVANAVLDGTDVLMLSGETASGRYPIEAVTTMGTIIQEIEGSDVYRALEAMGPFEDWDFAHACAASAAITSRHQKLAAVVVFTRLGHTANMVADYRPRAPIIAVCGAEAAARRMALQWGTIPVHHAMPRRAEDAVTLAAELAQRLCKAQPGDTIAVVSGSQRDTGTKYFALHTLSA